MARLSTSSGAISLGDLRTLYGETGSISLNDFRTSGSKYEEKNNFQTLTLSDAYVSTTDTFWRARTQQTATGTNGSGTVTTSYQQYANYKGTDTNGVLISNSSVTSRTYNAPPAPDITNLNLTFLNIPEFVDAVCTLSRGTLRSGGSYTSWSTQTDIKGNPTGSIRTKTDYYGLSISNSKKINGKTNLNPIISGSVSMSDLYSYDNGRHEVSFNAGGHANNQTGYARAGWFVDTAGMGSLVGGSGTSSNEFINSVAPELNDLMFLGCFVSNTINFYLYLGANSTSEASYPTAHEIGKFDKITVNNTDLLVSDCATVRVGQPWSSVRGGVVEYRWTDTTVTLPTISTTSANTVKINYAT
jgi:hypothetical protein